MKKLLKTLACSAVAALVGATAFADGLLAGTGNFIIGGTSYDCTSWSTSGGTDCTDLGYLSGLNLTGVGFDFWSDNSHDGANMWMELWDADGNKLGEISGENGQWLGSSTYIGGEYNHDYRIAWSGNLDASFGNQLVEGDVYYLDIWFKSYGSWDAWYPGNDGKYHTKFIYGDAPLFQTVTFDPGDYGTCSTETMTFDYGETYHDLPICSSYGTHARTGWYTVPDGEEGGTLLEEGAPVSGPANLKVYAHWTTEQKLTFDPQNGDDPWTETFTVATQYGSLPKPTWENHVFLGWFTEAEGGSQFSRFSKVTTKPVRTMYAHWTNEQTVTFDPRSGDAPWTEVYAMGGQFGPLPKPTWENHVFLGWFTEPEGGRQFSRFSVVTKAQTRTMYAHWLNEQTVTFDPQNGEAPWTEVYTMGTQFGPLPKPARAGYTFLGWFTESEGGRQFSRFSLVTKAQTRTMYAQWQAKDAVASSSLSRASRAKAGARAVGTYTLVTGSLTPGNYVITGNNASNGQEPAMVAADPSSNNYFSPANVAVDNGVISNPADNLVWEVAQVSGGWSIHSSVGYVHYSGTKNTANAEANLSNESTWTITVDNSGVATVANAANTDRILQYNSGSPRFACYTSSQKKLKFYKAAEASAQSVTLNPSEDQEVTVGDTVTIAATPDGFTCDDADIVWKWEVNGIEDTDQTSATYALDTTVAGEYTVKATASYGTDESAEQSVTITVVAPVVKYAIAIADGIVNGTVTTDPEDEAAEGSPVTVTATADSGYKLGVITVNGSEITGTTFEMPAEDVTVSATFVEKTGGTVTYTVTGKNAVSVEGDVPDGSSAAYSQTYGTAKQATAGNSFTLTLKGYEGLKIVGLTLSMHSNGSSGAGNLSVTCGDATIASITTAGFGDASWHGSYTTSYVDVTPSVTPTTVDGDVVIQIAATQNSLYCESYTVEYETVPVQFTITLDPAVDFEVAYNAYATITATPHNQAAGDVSYAWAIDGEPVAGVTGSVLTLDTTVPDVYEAVCTATDAGGAVATASVSYMVNEPASPSVSLVASAESVRIGDAVTITATASDFSGEVEWVWAGDGEAVDSGNTSVFTVDTSTAGDHVVMVEATYGTESADAEITIAVEGPHDIEVFAGDHGLASAPDTAYAGETVTVTVTPDDGYTLDTIVVNDGDVAVTGTSFVMPDDDALVEVTFTEIPETVEFVRVTSVDDLTAGEYVITGVKNAGNNEEYAMKAEVSTTSTKYLLRRTSAVTIQTDAETGAVSVTDASDDIIWTLAKDADSGDWTIYNSAVGYVFWASGNSANAQATTSDNSYWTISLNSDGDGTFAVKNAETPARNLRYNTNSGQERFAAYQVGSSGTLTGSGLNLYKKPSAVPMQTVTFDPGEYGTCDTEYMVFEFGGTYHDLPRCNSDGAHARIAWYTAPDGEGGDPVFDGDDVSGPEELTLYAHWTTEQTLTFDPQSDEEPWTEVYTVGTQYGPLPKPTWANHVFLGWFTEAEGGSQFSRFSRVITRPERTMYAHWLSEQTVTFDPQSDEEPWTETYEMGTQFGPLPKPKWANHVFLGWFTEPEGGSQFSRFSRVTAKAARTMYAHWLSEQTVTFEPQNGQDSWTGTYEMGTQFGPLPKPTWAGYKFLGWFTEPEGGSQFSRFSKVTTSPTRTMYAQWQEKASALSITAFAMTPRAVATAARSAASGTVECTLWFETVADVAYEIQWTASLDSDWVVLKGWISDITGETAVTVDIPADSPTGFFRLVEAAD